jgi:hypothetical protein
MSGSGKRFYGVVMGTRGLQKCGTVSKAVSVANGWYRLVLFSECWEAKPGVTSGAEVNKEAVPQEGGGIDSRASLSRINQVSQKSERRMLW